MPVSGTVILLVFFAVYYYLDYKESKKPKVGKFDDILNDEEYKVKGQWETIK